MINFAQFITPFQSQQHTLSATADDVINRMDAQDKTAQAQAQTQAQLAETARHNRADEAEASTRTGIAQGQLGFDYTKLQASTHQERQKLVRDLMSQYAAAQESGDTEKVKALEDALRSQGLTVDNGSAPAAPAPSLSPPGLGGKDFRGQAPQVQTALKDGSPASMQREIASDVGKQWGAVPSTMDPTKLPPNAAPAAAPAPKRGKYTVKDENGLTLGSYDEDASLKGRQDRVSARFDPMISAVTSHEELKAAKAAKDAAMKLTETGSSEEAIKAGEKTWTELMARYRKVRPDGSVGGDSSLTPMSKQEQGRLEGMTKDVNAALTQVRTTQKTPEAYSAVTKGQSWLGALNGAENGTLDRAALISTLKDLNGRAPPQVEFRSMLESAGLLAQFENALNQAATGELNPQLISNLKGIITQGVQIGQAKIRAAENAFDAQVEYMMPLATPSEKARIKEGAKYVIRGAPMPGIENSTPATNTAAPAKGAPKGAPPKGRSINDEMDEVLGAGGRK